MKLKYSSPVVCEEPVSASLSFLTGSNEGYDVDTLDPGFVNENYWWL